VIAYRRVSSAEQGAAFGPDAQSAAIEAFAKREGLEIVADHLEDLNGTTPLEDRPELREALAACAQGKADALLVARRDRLARDTYVALGAVRAFEAVGTRVLYAEGPNGNGDSGDDELIDTLGHAISARERRAIVARLRAGREAKAARYPEARAQGGGVPHGYRRTRTGLAVEPEAAQEVQRVFELLRSGLSVRKTAERMSEETGRAWRPNTVHTVATRKDYKRSPRIVDPRVWNATPAGAIQAPEALTLARPSRQRVASPTTSRPQPESLPPCA
jgi:DNA invertase Pin-like site-specific DNA recombinase